MPTNKILILSITISLAVHLGILSLTGLLGWKGKKIPERVMTLHLSDGVPGAEQQPSPPLEPPPHIPPSPEIKTYSSVLKGGKIREATVNLNSRKSRYRPYLSSVRAKIERAWIYPAKASFRKEQGTAVIRFSLADTGDLLDSTIIRSSGFRLLDEAGLRAVKNARFAPLPAMFQLSRLNIIVSFEYRLIR